MGGARPEVTGFFHEATGSVAYVAADPASGRAAIIDPVLDYDRNARATFTDAADEIIAFLAANGLTVEWVLDTHPHADHFSAAHYLKELLGCPMAIGDGVKAVQRIWKKIYNLPDFPADGAAWDRLFADGDTFSVGGIEARVMATPGHTAASVTYLIGDAAFVADTLFMPDGGTARADFPGGDARALYRSLKRILALPPETRLFTGHDYRPNGREARWQSSIAEQRRANPHLAEGLDEEAFVALRQCRDATLPLPALMVDALQVNMRGGRLPEPEDNGVSYLKIPLNRFPPRAE